MGCGKSKHDVAAGNTITRKKSEVGSSRGEDIEHAVKETSSQDINGKILVEQKGNQISSKELPKEAVAGVQDANVEPVADVQNANENEELKEGGKDGEKKDGNVVEKQEPGKLISEESPKNVVSSNIDEDVEGIVTEGRSGKDKSGKLDGVAKETLVEETKQETENGTEEPHVVKQENADEEAETGTSIEPEVASLPAKELENSQV